MRTNLNFSFFISETTEMIQRYACNEPFAKKFAESDISESESSLFCLLFHKMSPNFVVNGFVAKLLLLRFRRKSATFLSCSASDVFPIPWYDIFHFKFVLRELTGRLHASTKIVQIKRFQPVNASFIENLEPNERQKRLQRFVFFIFSVQSI